MKKLVVLLCALCLVGCSGKEAEKITKVCTMESDGMKVTNTLEAEDDKVVKQTAESSVDFSDLDATEADIKDVMDELASGYDDLKGVQYSYTIDGTTVNDKTIVDYTQADLDQLLEMGILESEEESVGYVSLEQTVKSLEDMGFTCK